LLIEAVEEVKDTLRVLEIDFLDAADAEKMDGIAKMVVPATRKLPKLQCSRQFHCGFCFKLDCAFALSYRTLSESTPALTTRHAVSGHGGDQTRHVS
jgi:hypothetical protein